MENQEHPKQNAVGKFFQEKGYYIVLLLCVAAVGISGYLFITGAVSEKNSLKEETLSVATSAAVPTETSVATPATTPKTASRPTPAKKEASLAPKAVEAAPIVTDEAVHEVADNIRIWPVSGQSLADYSMDALAYNETMRDWRTHDGVDLAAQSGAPVLAACGGTVSAVYDDEYLGTTVVISHADGYTTQYSNLAAMPTVSAGSIVQAGDTIGSVGATAALESGLDAHLHFAVYRNGESVSPESFVD